MSLGSDDGAERVYGGRGKRRVFRCAWCGAGARQRVSRERRARRPAAAQDRDQQHVLAQAISGGSRNRRTRDRAEWCAVRDLRDHASPDTEDDNGGTPDVGIPGSPAPPVHGTGAKMYFRPRPTAGFVIGVASRAGRIARASAAGRQCVHDAACSRVSRHLSRHRIGRAASESCAWRRRRVSCSPFSPCSWRSSD